MKLMIDEIDLKSKSSQDDGHDHGGGSQQHTGGGGSGGSGGSGVTFASSGSQSGDLWGNARGSAFQSTISIVGGGSNVVSFAFAFGSVQHPAFGIVTGGTTFGS